MQPTDTGAYRYRGGYELEALEKLVLALFGFGFGADHVSQALERQTPRTIRIPGPQHCGCSTQEQHQRKGGHESCSCVR